MRAGENRICEVCGQSIRPGGMGGHMRLKHGIMVKVEVKAPKKAIKAPEKASKNDFKAPEKAPEVVVAPKVQRPSDYVRKGLLFRRWVEVAPPSVVNPEDPKEVEKKFKRVRHGFFSRDEEITE